MAAGGGVDECVRAAFEDVLHDVGGWFLLVCWVGLAVRVRRRGAAVMAVIDGGGPAVLCSKAHSNSRASKNSLVYSANLSLYPCSSKYNANS